MATEEAEKPVEVYYSYHKKDEKLLRQLEEHLRSLKRKKLINTWGFYMLRAGEERTKAINDHLNTADIILLLVSPYFLASDYCYEIEVKRAMERFEAGEAIVIPIIVRPVDWTGTPFNKLEPLPIGDKAVSEWRVRDRAFRDISLGIEDAAKTIQKRFRVVNNQVRSTPLIQESEGVFVKNYPFNIAIAFALEDLSYAEALTYSLRTHGIKVFFYTEGINEGEQFAFSREILHNSLFDLNYRQWRYCILLLSRNYAIELANHEREAFLTHALQEQGYILPIYLDETVFPDINEDTAFPIKWHEIGLEDIAELLARKVREVSRIIPED